MSEVPTNPFAVPDGRRPDQASALNPSPDPGGSPYGQPAAPVPAWGTPVYPSGAPPYGPYVAPTYAGPYSPPGYPYPYPHPYTAQGGSNGLAIAAMIVGIASVALCMFVVPAIVGLVLGIVALGQAKKGASGRGMAIAGVVTSAVGLALGVVFIIIGMVSDGSTADDYGSYTTQGPAEQVTSDDLAALHL